MEFLALINVLQKLLFTGKTEGEKYLHSLHFYMYIGVRSRFMYFNVKFEVGMEVKERRWMGYYFFFLCACKMVLRELKVECSIQDLLVTYRSVFFSFQRENPPEVSCCVPRWFQLGFGLDFCMLNMCKSLLLSLHFASQFLFFFRSARFTALRSFLWLDKENCL